MLNRFLKDTYEHALNFDTPFPYVLGNIGCMVIALILIWGLDQLMIGWLFILIQFGILYKQITKFN